MNQMLGINVEELNRHIGWTDFEEEEILLLNY
jgi:hypothetical protein